MGLAERLVSESDNSCAVTTADAFDMPHPRSEHGVCRWIVTEFYTSGQGSRIAGLRSIDGAHFAAVHVANLRPTNIARGGAAAALAAFAEHQAAFVRRAQAMRTGDIVAAAEAQSEMDAVNERHGLRLGHV